MHNRYSIDQLLYSIYIHIKFIGHSSNAVKIGKPYSTMMREVNPNDKGAKVGADTLMDIVRATKDISPLVFMAKELGYRLVPVSKDEGEEDSAAL